MRNAVIIFFHLVCLFVAMNSHAYTACFTLDKNKGCAPLTIKSSDCSGISANPNLSKPQYNFGDGLGYRFDSTYTYNNAGTYQVYQRIDNGNGGWDYSTSPLTVTVVASPLPNYKLLNCINNQTTVQILDNVYDQYKINFGDGSPIQTTVGNSSISHNYAANGNYNITVDGVFLPNSVCATKTSTVFSFNTLITPTLEYLKVLKQSSTGQLELALNLTSGYAFQIEEKINNGLYTAIDTLYPTTNGIQSIQFINRNTATNNYSYRVSVIDDCSNAIQGPSVTSVILQATAQNNVNVLNWSDYSSINSNLTSYNLYKNSTLLTNTGTSITYNDNVVICNQNYCYQTQAILNQNNSTGAPILSYSIDSCIKSISTNVPPAVTQVNSTVQNDRITITWNSTASNVEYIIQESTNNSLFYEVGRSTTTSFTKNNRIRNYYRIEYLDNCNLISTPSLSTMTSELFLQLNGDQLTLTWTPYVGFDNLGISNYVVEQLDNQGNVLQSINANLSTTYTTTINPSSGTLYYRIRINSVSAIQPVSYSNVGVQSFDAELYVPTVFTPNNDSNNDEFVLKGKYITTYTLKIFNRWGEQVFESNDLLKSWDGLIGLNLAPSAAYTWTAQYSDQQGKSYNKTGTVTLIR